MVVELNANPEVHGILVQLPLPKHINEERILSAISIEKDVDGFHPLNIGKLAMKGREPLFVPCTPKGCIELLDRYGVEIAGKNAVVIGRSNIVGHDQGGLRDHRCGYECRGRSHGQERIPSLRRRRFQGRRCGGMSERKCYEKCRLITPVPGGVGPMTIAMLMKNTVESGKRAIYKKD